MSEVAILAMLYAVGVLLLVGEIFIPSHGVLSLAGLGFLVAAVVKTFDYAGRGAGIIAVFAYHDSVTNLEALVGTSLRF